MILLFILFFIFFDKNNSFYVKPLQPFNKLNDKLKMQFNDNDFKQESISELYKDIDKQTINEIYVSNDLKKIYIKENLNEEQMKEYGYKYNYKVVESNPYLTNKLIEKTENTEINTFVMQTPTSVIQSGLNAFSGVVNGFILPSIFLSIVISYARVFFAGNNFNTGGGNSPLSPFQNFRKDFKKDKENMIKANITLNSWAGNDEIFQEVTEVVSYLKNETMYKNAGAEIPKGILLEGPPGTGKTLLAKAIASECDANFISIASSEFVEVYVGLGASKVRDLFKKARENKPCILFIDEIDSIGKQRGTGINLGNDEREQTLNQLLAEMDGFNENDGILILGATNRRDVLDNALLRPGRFDRIINVPLPDKPARIKILKTYGSKKKLSSDVSYDLLGEFTSGFSGAQIKNLMNEAAINAAREGKSIINQKNFEDAVEKLVVGIIKKDDIRSEETIKRVSIHEIGHTFIAAYFNKYFDLKKVSIQSTFNGAGGYTLFGEKPEIIDGGLYTKDLLKKRLMIAMGGKAAETLYYGHEQVSLGAIQDLKQANTLAQSMIGNYGMGKELMVFYNEDTESGRNPFLGRSLGMGAKYSDKTKEIFDKEALDLVKDAFEEALDLLNANKDTLNVMIKDLEENKILDGNSIMKYMNDVN